MFIFAVGRMAAQSWELQTSGSAESLRGLSAVSTRVVWASGTRGTYLRTADGGLTWKTAQVPGAEDLDFRDVEALSEREALLMSAGPGDKSRIYRTSDGGEHWSLLFTNPDAKGFFDSLALWDARRAIVVGDAVDGRAALFTTSDGGRGWVRQRTPDAIDGEGSFAASGTCVVTLGRKEAWYVTGGKGAARVFRSRDGGRSWKAAPSPIRNDGRSAGVFSIAFANGRDGVIVGGDYAKPGEAGRNAAVTRDGGATWREPRGRRPEGFRSAVAYVPKLRAWIAAGTSGSDISRDNGESWTRFDDGAFNAVSFARSGEGWAVGPRGRVARLRLSQLQ